MLNKMKWCHLPLFSLIATRKTNSTDFIQKLYQILLFRETNNYLRESLAEKEEILADNERLHSENNKLQVTFSDRLSYTYLD